MKPIDVRALAILTLTVFASSATCVPSRRPKTTFATVRPEEACSVLLDGSASIRVSRSGQGWEDCIPTGMCAMGSYCPPGNLCGPSGARMMEISITGRLSGTAQSCHVSACIALDTNQDRPIESQLSPSVLMSERPGAKVQEYLCTGYSETDDSYPAGGKAALRYPSASLQPNGSRVEWIGKVALEGVPAIGGLIRGRMEYHGRDGNGQERYVSAQFSVPRYPDKS